MRRKPTVDKDATLYRISISCLVGMFVSLLLVGLVYGKNGGEPELILQVLGLSLTAGYFIPGAFLWIKHTKLASAEKNNMKRFRLNTLNIPYALYLERKAAANQRTED